MTTHLYRLVLTDKSLQLLNRTFMDKQGLGEAGDLENWLASCKDKLFDRKILWLGRQDRAAHDQRSDLIGLSSDGDLVVTELKRGKVGQEALIQVLAYAAEYESKTPKELAELYHNHSLKDGASALVDKAKSLDEAEKRISQHVGDKEVNQSQILILLTEGFDDKTLAICDYLSRSTGEATFSIELWEYGVCRFGEDGHIFRLEQILPPPNIREQIEADRKAAKNRKWARDPSRSQFVSRLQQFLASADSGFFLNRNSGESYSGRIDLKAGQIKFFFGRWDTHPRIEIPDSLEIVDQLPNSVRRGKDNGGVWWLEFTDVNEASAFTDDFGVKLIDVLNKITVPNAGI